METIEIILTEEEYKDFNYCLAYDNKETFRKLMKELRDKGVLKIKIENENENELNNIDFLKIINKPVGQCTRPELERVLVFLDKELKKN